jgi:creatinine amidohydrolase
VVERRYERLRPAEMRRLVAEAPVAWIPMGTLEWHGEHLPFGVDGFEAHGICLRAAARAGGVVLPPTYTASGVLDLEFSLTFDLDLVLRLVSATVERLVARGFRFVVILTGHGPLDLSHGLKQTAAALESQLPGVFVYALCWLELNAARVSEPQQGEPVVVDHAALVETSYMLSLEPDLVSLERLPDDPDARPVGVYGRNPRFTASPAWGETSLEAAVELLAERVAQLRMGGRVDPYEDLRRFVDYCWHEPLTIAGRAGPPGQAALLLTNPGASSRYLTSISVALAGEELSPDRLLLVNENVGEGRIVRASELGPLNGFYIRREQTALLRLPAGVAPGAHRLTVRVGLGGVRTDELAPVVDFR